MPADVIDFAAARQEREPHASGVAACLDCKHEWQAVAPADMQWMECPSCGLVRGRFKFQHERDGDHWVCNCGNDLFHVTPEGTYCPNCGVWQVFDEQGVSMVSRRVQVARPERNSRNIAYNVWKKMRDRCNNPNSDHYKWYGAKGITVCERWDSFDNFISDMGKRPSLKHSIDRIDNALGYEPGNFRWATQAEQNMNRAANTYITHNGKTQCMAAWAEELVVNKTTVAKRIKRGWENSDAVTILSMSTRNSHASRNHHKGVKHGSHETPRRGGNPRTDRRPPGATCRGGNSGAQCGPGDDEVAPAQAPFLAT